MYAIGIDGTRRVDGIIGDNIEYLEYLEVQGAPSALGLPTWEVRLIVATRETIKIYRLPAG